MILEGIPPYTPFEEQSLVTTNTAAMTTLSPIVTPGKIVTRGPTQTLTSIFTGFFIIGRPILFLLLKFHNTNQF